MSQHDMNLANAAGAAFRADLNDALAALVSNSSGATAPATTFSYQLWADTTTGLLKIRNAANSAWITVGTLASTNLGLQVQDGTLDSLSGLSLVQGDILYATAADTLARLAKGTAAQQIRMNAGATAPEWFTPSSSGAVVKVVEATPIATVVTLSATTPHDDTIPQNTEGTEVITVSITPSSATNRLRIEFDAPSIGTASTSQVTAALFQDSTAGALAAGYSLPSGNSATTSRLVHEMAAGTTSATTFKIRIGVASGTAYVNGNYSGTRVYGGVSAARLRVTEITP